jgi:prepilin-type N-terminal cleavage/methylation domain-containing protein/prepilin-type processing-associated H-X9-DG protein
LRARRAARRGRRGAAAFTLIELLVVIAIIALLLSILLPSLKNAKALAKRVTCAGGMKGLSSAVLGYANDCGGRVLPQSIHPDWAGGMYPRGDFWSNMLVRGKFASGPNAADTPAEDDRSIFRCPEGTRERAPGVMTLWAESHRLPELFHWRALFEYDLGGGSSNKLVEVEDLAVRTWYALNAGNQAYVPSTWRLGDYYSPKEWYRTSQQKRASELVMMTDGSLPNQFWQCHRVAGRHAPISRDGRHGYGNLAFWDGHVRVYDTERFDAVRFGGSLRSFDYETIFFFDQEHRTGHYSR